MTKKVPTRCGLECSIGHYHVEELRQFIASSGRSRYTEEVIRRLSRRACHEELLRIEEQRNAE